MRINHNEQGTNWLAEGYAQKAVVHRHASVTAGKPNVPIAYVCDIGNIMGSSQPILEMHDRYGTRYVHDLTDQ